MLWATCNDLSWDRPQSQHFHWSRSSTAFPLELEVLLEIVCIAVEFSKGGKRSDGEDRTVNEILFGELLFSAIVQKESQTFEVRNKKRAALPTSSRRSGLRQTERLERKVSLEVTKNGGARKIRTHDLFSGLRISQAEPPVSETRKTASGMAVSGRLLTLSTIK
jgi:hypothetical protein